MRQPIRQQLLRPLLAVMVSAVIAVAGLSAWVSSSRQVEFLRGRQAAVARVLEDATFPLTAPVLRQMADLSEQEFVVWSPGQHVVRATSYPDRPEGLNEELQRIAGEDGSIAAESSIAIDGAAMSVGRVSRRGRMEEELLILTPRRSLLDARLAAVLPPLALGGVALAVLVPLVLRLTGRWSSRMETIQRAVAEIARGDLTATLAPSDGDDELAALVRDIDQMRRQLGTLQAERLRTERERMVAQLAAGFAHQFRNGIAGATLALDLHRSRCGQRDDQSLSVARRQLQLLEAEVRGILALARTPESPRGLFDLCDLARDAAELVAPHLAHHGITLAVEAESQSATMTGHTDAIRSAVLNLLLNGIDAAGPGGRLRLGVCLVGANIILAVADNGPGPAPEVQQRLTEAFVTTKPEGIGLGLTIVAAAAHDHGGQFTWRRENEWTVMELRLPRDGERIENPA